MTRRDHDGPEDDELLPRLFRALGPAPTLPEEMRRAWEATFGDELARRIAARRGRRFRMIGGAVAALLTVFAAVTLLAPPPPSDAAEAQPTRIAMVAGSAETIDAGATRPLHVGDAVNTGETLHTLPGALLALHYRGADVRLDADTVIAVLPTRLQLIRGAVYVDSGAGPSKRPSVMIETPRGMLTHVGTQFQVVQADGEMRVAVREGAVAFTSATEHRTISAADGAVQLVVSDAGVTLESIGATGPQWRWIVEATPGYVVDGRSADDVLVWATRQIGARLRYTDEAARFHSKTVIMHGDARRLSVAQGLEILDATTGLDLDTSDPATLQVSVRRNP